MKPLKPFLILFMFAMASVALIAGCNDEGPYVQDHRPPMKHYDIQGIHFYEICHDGVVYMFGNDGIVIKRDRDDHVVTCEYK